MRDRTACRPARRDELGLDGARVRDARAARHAPAHPGVRQRASGQPRAGRRDRPFGARRAASPRGALHRGGARRRVRALDARRARRSSCTSTARRRTTRTSSRCSAAAAGGARISKSNGAWLRYREPVYRTLRELAMSYFHEYFDTRGRKTLRSYSGAFDLARVDPALWVTSEASCWAVHDRMAALRHYPLVTAAQANALSRRDAFECRSAASGPVSAASAHAARQRRLTTAQRLRQAFDRHESGRVDLAQALPPRPMRRPAARHGGSPWAGRPPHRSGAEAIEQRLFCVMPRGQRPLYAVGTPSAHGARGAWQRAELRIPEP